MNILGIHCGHNSSAALMIRGKIAGAFQEERFTKTKNQVSFPIQSIRELLKQFLNNDINQLDSISFFTKNVDPIGLAISRYSNYTVNDHIEENYKYWYPLFYENKKDLIVYTTEPLFLPVFGFFLYKLKSLNYIIILYDLYPEILIDLGIIGRNNFIAQAWHYLNYLSYRNSEEIIVLSKDMKKL